MPSLFDTERHEKLVNALVKVLNTRDDIVLVWLEGSLASGAADRYSEIDLHVALEDEDVESFCGDRWKLMNSVSDPVVLRELAGPLNELLVLFDNGLILKLTTEKASQLQARPREHIRILMDRDGYSDELEIIGRPGIPREFRQERVTRDIGEFWLSVASFPKEVRRGTPIALCQSHVALLRALTVRMLMASKDGVSPEGVEPSTGLSLDGYELGEVESCADQGPSLADTWRTMIRICQLFSRYARKTCLMLSLRYPDDMEVSVRAFVYCELNDKLSMSEWWKP